MTHSTTYSGTLEVLIRSHLTTTEVMSQPRTLVQTIQGMSVVAI